jgi:uncharacterized protein (TIGR03067 family)
MMILFLALITGVQPPQDPIVLLELGKLKGTWQIISSQIDGKDNSAGLKEVRFVFSGQVMTLIDKNGKAVRRKADGKVEERKFKLNVEAQPKEIDLTISEKFLSPGIYLLEGDTLKLCTAEPGLPRPAQFQAKSGVSLVVLKRISK